MIDLREIKSIIEIDFRDIIDRIIITEINEMRIFLKDDTFIDIWYSLKLKDRFSYHWERKFKDGTIYRHDNIPHNSWRKVETFPKHFHKDNEKEVTESYIHSDPETGIREFLRFVRNKLNQEN
ncbi:MAG: hypothetical protein KGY74_09995 [Candidatus Cloacimonetes bacterium]|nr:hypothetical protein [Candidatus Cloacimonadota bacterium]